jgi:hypothetical protein
MVDPIIGLTDFSFIFYLLAQNIEVAKNLCRHVLVYPDEGLCAAFLLAKLKKRDVTNTNKA